MSCCYQAIHVKFIAHDGLFSCYLDARHNDCFPPLLRCHVLNNRSYPNGINLFWSFVFFATLSWCIFFLFSINFSQFRSLSNEFGIPGPWMSLQRKGAMGLWAGVIGWTLFYSHSKLACLLWKGNPKTWARIRDTKWWDFPGSSPLSFRIISELLLFLYL